MLAALAAVLTVTVLAGCTDDSPAVAGPPRTPTATATTQPWDDAAGVSIVAIGDSITGGHGLTTGQAWPAMVADQEGWALTNLSCDGAGVAAIGDADACASAYSTLVKRAVDLHPSVVFLQASSNDLGLDTAEVRSATDRVVDDVHRRLPGRGSSG